MPLRPLERAQSWLMPPSLDDLIPPDHPVRFVAEFVDALTRADWALLEITLEGEVMGAPAYDPRALLAVWLYGFMTGVRSSRRLESACRDQLPYLWLTGRQHPDHNTLWRFYQEHREALRRLLKQTVRTAVKMDLIDLAVHAVDGTKIAANAAKERTYDKAALQRLLERTDAAIADLEAHNATGGDPPPPRLPDGLTDVHVLRSRLQAALAQVTADDGPRQVNLTDPDARLMKGRQGFVAGYNAQASVAALNTNVAGRTGLLIVAADVTTQADDHAQLLPMMQAAEDAMGQPVEYVLADGGYHSGAVVQACAERSQAIVMPEGHRRADRPPSPYHADAFSYDSTTDSYTCPEGQVLHFAGTKHRRDANRRTRVYRVKTPSVCRTCPAFGVCTTNGRHGRVLQPGPHDGALRQHRAWMATPQAKALYRQRQYLPEPVFGLLKEGQGARRFLLRGLARVRAEWSLLTTAFNLRTLSAVWRAHLPQPSWVLAT